MFVDSARAAQEAVARNIQALRMAERAALYRCDWRSAIGRLRAAGERFDLVFLDPPYGMRGAEAVLPALRESGLLAEDALVMYEYARALPPVLDGWLLADQRNYRDTAIAFLRVPQEEDAHADGAVSGEL